MYQGQRPSKHIRRVHTRQGMRYANVNPEIQQRKKVVFDKNTTNKQYKKKLKIVDRHNDADGDGVKNKDDCMPFDKDKQDVYDDDGHMMDSIDETSDSEFESYEIYEHPKSSTAQVDKEFRGKGW